ncbi:hypothetical protein K435DRAFT_821093 [Dendrothele bispora CBS 962.96]|uniref:Man1/Src1 C-terminal domain-containing protein n=1 Tax=Dendrothele bispora (strain CBS 962.96) TaxID=1314807 RepID=A0A4S8LN39_DENBC|nr:hypothetical protein K435DRAFT_821093 [Dendrothele bispora CBS 962.96]
MSTRLTAAQLIAQGDYLESDFQPSSLTVSQLLGILGYHNVVYPTPYTKPKLVQVFNDEIKKKASKLKKERLKKENSIASDEGIKDGITGELLSGRPAPTRRSSRRLSRAPPDEDEDIEPVRPDPPKRRRSSAEPRLGGTSRKSQLPVEPPVQEESEPEEVDVPARKVSKTKKADAAGRQSRRVSQAEDSGWEDNNIFQSGAESSSPMRPSPIRSKPRRSTAPRKSRKSMSAPPQVSPLSSPPKVSRFPVSPPQSKFEPELPDFGTPSTRRSSGVGVGPSSPFTPPVMMTKEEEVDLEGVVTRPEVRQDYIDTVEAVNFNDEGEEAEAEEEDGEEKEQVEEDEEVDFNAVVQQRIADGGQELVLAEDEDEDALQLSRTSPLAQLFRILFFGLLTYMISEYKKDSASIGYCNTGSGTNDILEELRSTRQAIELCNKENRTTLYDGVDSPACPLPPIVPLLRPDSCTPCPDHAICSGHDITCEKAYTLRPPLLLSFLPPPPKTTNESFSLSLPPSEVVWRAISGAADGLPGLGPVGMVPRCVVDPRRKRNIGVLGKAIESWLAVERGTRLCAGEAERPIEDSEGGEARRWGLRLTELRDRARQAVGSDGDLVHFDDLFNEAVQQLLQWGGVLMSEDSSGKRYLAHKTPSMSLTCQLTVKTRNFWVEWRATFVAIVSVIGAVWANRSRRAQKKLDNKRVAELVQIALETLRHQEMAHYTDPVTAPEPFLSSLQLRDLVLQDEHSVVVRKRLWDQVEKVVESNANVRANLEEVEGGDELRVWRWVGSAGRIMKSVKFTQLSTLALG